MVSLNVFNPSGATEITQLHAARLDSLANKNVAMLSDDMWQAHRMLPLIQEHLETHYPGIEVMANYPHPRANHSLCSGRLPSHPQLLDAGVCAKHCKS